jgi:hypothetical protein
MAPEYIRNSDITGLTPSDRLVDQLVSPRQPLSFILDDERGLNQVDAQDDPP